MRELHMSFCKRIPAYQYHTFKYVLPQDGLEIYTKIFIYVFIYTFIHLFVYLFYSQFV